MIKMRYLKHGGVLLPDFKGKEARHCSKSCLRDSLRKGV